MTKFEIIVLIIGFGLLTLGSCSGYAIYRHAIKIPDKFGNEVQIASMWALFLIGLIFGLVLIWFALPK
jgi:hypothetical protein